MSQLSAIVRQPPSSLGRCELTHLSPTPIDHTLAVEQHAAYVQALRDAGCLVESLSPLEAFPDSPFVEDVAIVLDELAIATRPGANSRRGEVEHILDHLGAHRDIVVELPESVTLDGGDVLRHERTLYVGQSSRSNPAGAAALAASVAGMDYRVVTVPVTGALHLKTACTFIDERTLLVNPQWIDSSPLVDDGFELHAVAPEEPFGANVLRIGDQLLMDAAAENTVHQLSERGHHVTALDISEFAKAEAGLTCLSLVFA